ncbi:MAG: ADP-ribosylglycohydrolase [Syntrophus sp. PtaU1.Bin208]|nr:MAG: ADP-ribosylglycohydrolase [Syntrophus sp. PtaU1.Bin208]
MIGAIAGDVIGSVYEHSRMKTLNFPLFQEYSRFTDDTVMTLAIADAIINSRGYAESMKSFGRRYPKAGYGRDFLKWILASESKPYNSWGNGSAMRASPIGFAYPTVETVMAEARKSAEVSHDHPEGIKGAQAAALAVFLARTGKSKKEIREEISGRFAYNLDRTVDDIRPNYRFDASCQGSVPEAIIAFLDSKNYEDAIRKAVSLGGDSDTLACIAGGIAQAFYGEIPPEILAEVRKRLPGEFLTIIDRFHKEYIDS